jgi:hypothetical protein
MLARKYMKSAIPNSATFPCMAPKDMNAMKHKQKIITGHVIRMFKVTRAPESFALKVPSIIGRNESRPLMIRFILN